MLLSCRTCGRTLGIDRKRGSYESFNKGRYAIRFMLDLALHNTGEPVRIKDVSGRQGISDKYLEQVVSILNKAGFVRSIRSGPQGGYVLTRDPKITQWVRSCA